MTHLKFLLFFLLFSLNLNAQQLARAGYLGIHLQDSKIEQGVEVLKVLSNSTASAIGLEVNDVIVKMNASETPSTQALIAVVAKWSVGETLRIDIKRNGEEKELKGIVIAKPIEISEVGTLHYDEVAYDGGALRTILEMPKGVKNPPVLMYLPGIGCSSYDFALDESHVIKLFIESIVSQGIAVFRVEKPGMGDSKGTTHCEDMDYKYELGAYKAALEKLKQHPGLDQKKVFLYGESLSTVAAPILAQKNEVAGIVVWGGLSKTWYEYYMDLIRKQKVLFGLDFEEIDKEFREVQTFYFKFMVEKYTPDELAAIDQFKDLVEQFFINDRWLGLHHYSFFHTLNEIDVLTNYKKANCPVLALSGESDIHTSNETWADEICAAVNYYNPGMATKITIPETTHHYFKVPSVKEYYELIQTGKLDQNYKSKNFNEEIPNAICKWVLDYKI